MSLQLGRRADPDARDRAYLLDRLLPSKIILPLRKTWRINGRALDQGMTGTCFPAGTRVLMADGSNRPLEEVRLLEAVTTAEGNSRRVTGTMVRQYDGYLVRLKLWGHKHLRMTPEHPVLTRRGYVTAGEVKPGDWVALTRQVDRQVVESIRTAPYLTTEVRPQGGRSGRIRYAGAVVLGREKTAMAVECVAVPQVIQLTPAFGRLVGLYLAEGSWSDYKAIFTFGRTEVGTLVAETVRLCQAVLGIEPHVQYRPNNSINVNLHGLEIARFFRRLLGHGAATKHLPADLAAGPDEFLSAVLDGWMAGDGHERRGSHQGVTISHGLALDMFRIAQQLGCRPAITRSQPKNRRVRWDVTWGGLSEDTYRSEQDDAAVWRRVRGLAYEEFSGPVFNLSVEDEQSYVAEGIGVHNCVGHGWRNFLRAAPIQTEKTGPSPFDIYRSAVLKDPWADNDDEATLPDGDPGMDFGTSVRAGAQAVMGYGRLASYVWAFSLQSTVEWVLLRGPVVLGTNWYDSMWETDTTGLVRIAPGAQVVGGHCYLLRGVDTHRALATCNNSWGDQWGHSGDFLLSLKDLERLIAEGGEVCTAVEQKVAGLDG